LTTIAKLEGDADAEWTSLEELHERADLLGEIAKREKTSEE